MSLADSPIRYPDTRSRSIMTRRGWWLVGLNILIPGSAQSLAGNHRLGRFGLGSTFVLWLALVALLVAWLVWPATVYTLLSNSVVLWVLALAAVFYAVLWVVLTLDTLRLVRLVRTVPAARAGISALAITVMVVASGTAAYGAYVSTTASGFLSSVFVAGPSEPPIDGRYNVLLLGGDAGPDREGLRPDSVRVVSIDADTGQAVTIGLPRDLTNVPFDEDSPMREVYPDGYGAFGVCDVDVCQLNSIYTEVELKSPERYPDAVAQGSEPGIEAMRDAAEGVTGLTIQYYVLIDMAGFQQLIDALGGVTVDVPHDVPIHADETFTTVAEWIPEGEQHLDGYHALWYARSRHGTSDYDRMARQLQIQEAVLAQFNAANVLSKFQEVAAAGSQVVKTDVPQSMLGYFVDLAAKTRELPIIDVPLVPDNGVDPLAPDYEAIRQMIDAAMVPVTPEPSEG
ncbi:LCP family protein [Agromyces sp. SYSU T0242]|uniref:LCP family protein n=1 Tax=Agromyces litoreus TaxID=3158561 RepID=UPI0033954157